MNDCCLTLLCPPREEEQLLDLLLMSAGSEVFTSTAISAHGFTSGQLSASEQVMGRARATQVQVLLAEPAKDALLAAIHEQFPGVNLRYWVTPVLKMGKVE